jgi:hypothetical protein
MYSETDYIDERSILKELVKYDNLVERFYEIIRKYQSVTSEISSYVDSIDDLIVGEFNEIEDEMNTRLKGICSMMCNLKDQVLTNTIKYKNEIFLLTRGNDDLLEEIRKLKEQIKTMEKRIGKENSQRLMNYTK